MKKIRMLSLFIALLTMLCFLFGCSERASNYSNDDGFLKDKYGDSQNNAFFNEGANDTTETQPTTSANTIDPFYNVSITVSGISPYCTIAVNNSNCSTEVQKYVIYEYDKAFYANNETATITAKLSGYAAGEEYVLKSTEMKYTVAEQPEYVTNLSETEISFIENELNDYVKTRQASDTRNQYIFGYNAGFLSYIDAVSPENEVYFSALKMIKYDQFEKMDFFNRYSRLYSISYTTRNGDSHTIYAAISANNIVKYADGSIKWGLKTLGDYDFTCESNGEGLESCISIHIMGNSADYNIAKIR